MGRAKRWRGRTLAPSRSPLFNERSDHAGVKVQVEQFSACKHARWSISPLNERVRIREKCAGNYVFELLEDYLTFTGKFLLYLSVGMSEFRTERANK